jgi:nicotinamidase-related amidase
MTSRKPALIIVDMLNDFVTGSLACERAERIIGPLTELIAAARKAGVPVIYANDAHLKGIDHELKLWGDHALAGTPGADVIPELAPAAGDYIVPKRRYSAFFQTDMKILLDELGVDTVAVCGMHTHMCCRHTAADAYQYGSDIIAPEDGLDAFTAEDHEAGMAYLKGTYGAEITTCAELAARFA